MSETGTQTRAKRTARIGAGRLYQNRWMLAAAIVAVLVVHFLGSTSQWVTAAAVLALVLFALVAPRTPAAKRMADAAARVERSPLDRLSGEKLAAAVADPLIIFDRDGAVVHANAAAQRAFGAIRPEVPLLLMFRAPEMQALIEGALAGGNGPQGADYIERVPFERVYRVTAYAVERGTGLFVLAFRDQSEARRIDRMRADFIANASHELRTPLASIAGFVETLRGPARNDANARDQFLQIMQNQTGRMARLIDDLLSLSRLEMKPHVKPGGRVDLRQTVESVIASLAPLAADTGVVVDREFGEGSFEVEGDRDELFQVFQNLLENACKYGQSGGRVIVSMRHSMEGGEPEIEATVRDFGPGIPAEHIPRVTERFYRVDLETSRAQKGTGLGLSIVKHILSRHNGRLSIKSELGEGTAFSVHLPAR
ncbi:ATP-binding protein [Mesorhizobium sp. ANAO-SY3R2]|uniref:ATP-binding protein n=1 Tax=Mesorhizobium sp. ANAO-SY3R2 TaxID=3166644 RepID=UPI0036709E49